VVLEQSEPTQTKIESSEPEPQSPFMSLLLPVLTAIGTGIGAIGFVIFFGGFILWSRFAAAGLPAEEAVSHVPRGDLVATGASFIVPAILAALVAAGLAVAGWDLAVGSDRRDRARGAEKKRLAATQRIEGLEEEAIQLDRSIEKLEEKQAENVAAVARAPADSTELDTARHLQDTTKREHELCQDHLQRLRDAEIPDAKKTQRDAAAEEAKVKNRSKGQRYTEYVIGAIPMVLAEGIIVFIALTKVPFFWSGLLLIGISMATFAIAIAVASMTEHFAWYTLCVFLGVGITVAFATYVRTQENPKVSPLAAIHEGVPVAGFLVAEASDAVYVGSPEPDFESSDLDFNHDGVTLLRFPKESLSALTIGPLMNEDTAYRRATLLARALCYRSIADSVQPGSKALKCAGSVKQALKHRLATIEAHR
jgi:hypothetical protein